VTWIATGIDITERRVLHEDWPSSYLLILKQARIVKCHSKVAKIIEVVSPEDDSESQAQNGMKRGKIQH
jgi:hypothetical protein